MKIDLSEEFTEISENKKNTIKTFSLANDCSIPLSIYAIVCNQIFFFYFRCSFGVSDKASGVSGRLPDFI